MSRLWTRRAADAGLVVLVHTAAGGAAAGLPKLRSHPGERAVRDCANGAGAAVRHWLSTTSGTACDDCCVETPHLLRSDRLVLRRWRDSDREPFATMNSDPAVMEFYPSILTSAESNALVDSIEATFRADGLGLWAVEVIEVAPFVGYVGLWPALFEASFTPAIEIGWRIAPAYWGHGYAPEAARVALADGFNRLGLKEVVSFTAAVNHRSRRVMEKIGMRRDPEDDFDHPAVPEGHPLRLHVLYRVSSPLELPPKECSGATRESLAPVDHALTPPEPANVHLDRLASDYERTTGRRVSEPGMY